MADLTRDDLIEAAKIAHAGAPGPLSRPDFERISGISQYHIYRLFPEGGWSELKRFAGLNPHVGVGIGDVRIPRADRGDHVGEELVDLLGGAADELGGGKG